MDVETIASAGGSDAGAGPQETQKAEAPVVAPGDSGKDQTKPGAEQRGNEPSVERHKLKFGKSERELSTEELKMMAQKGWASDQRFQEAARMRKEVEESIKQANWDKLIEKQTGKSAIEFYKDKLKAEIRKAQMTDNERAVETKRGELEALKAEEAQIKAQREEAQLKEQEQHYSQQWDKELSEAIEKEGLPKTKYAVQRAIQIGKRVVDMELEPDWTAVVREAKSQIQDDLKGLVSAMKEDPALLAFLGVELGMRISKAMVNRKQPVQQGNRKAVESFRPERVKEQKQVDVDAWIANRRKAFENS